jgi:hypothetical protein
VSDVTRWPARRSAGGDAALWVAGALLFVALAALVFGGSREPGLAMLGLVILAAVLGGMGAVLLVWAIAYQRLAYSLTDSALRIDWLGRTVVVPYPAIQGIYTGQRLEGNAAPKAPRWPGISVGSARVRGLGRLRFFATSTDQSALTYITVEHGGVIVSAQNPADFRAALIERVELSTDSSRSLESRVWQQTPATTAPWTALGDVWLPMCVVAGTLTLLLVVASIALAYPSLPDQLAIHFDAGGRANLIAARSDLVRLPFFGLICLVVDWMAGIWVHPQEKVLARVLWLGGAVVQVVLLIGVIRIVT